MRILLLGSGGREHALAWKIAQSPLTDMLLIAPGNGGTRHLGTNLDIPLQDFRAITEAVLEYRIDMVVVGPEQPLVDGIKDHLSADNRLGSLLVLGPDKAGAALEGSKDFAKAFMQRHGIPTATYRRFASDEFNAAAGYLETIPPPYVLKADGLAAGKGVIICDDMVTARENLHDMLIGGRFGAAGKTVVIEAFLDGIELSVFVLTDGRSYRILPAAKDYKRIGEGDTGPNTGGMGTVSPVPFANTAFMDKVEKHIIQPTIKGLRDEGIDYRGFIFFGLMNVKGEPFVIEYNVRLGDPEAESILPRISGDLVPLMAAAAAGDLGALPLATDDRTAVTVMLVSGGYPGPYTTGKIISGLEDVSGSLIFHAGTGMDKDGQVVSQGGRVLAVTSLGNTISDCMQQVYHDISQVSFEGMGYRKDIGQDLLPYFGSMNQS